MRITLIINDQTSKIIVQLNRKQVTPGQQSGNDSLWRRKMPHIETDVEPRTPGRRRANPDAKPGPKLAKNFVDSEFQVYGSLKGVGPETSAPLRS